MQNRDMKVKPIAFSVNDCRIFEVRITARKHVITACQLSTLRRSVVENQLCPKKSEGAFILDKAKSDN